MWSFIILTKNLSVRLRLIWLTFSIIKTCFCKYYYISCVILTSACCMMLISSLFLPHASFFHRLAWIFIAHACYIFAIYYCDCTYLGCICTNDYSVMRQCMCCCSSKCCMLLISCYFLPNTCFMCTTDYSIVESLRHEIEENIRGTK